MLSITIIIIIITCIVSLTAFSNQKILNDLIFYPPAVTDNRQYYRFITCGFIHADFFHLLFNMYAFYLFGGSVEGWFVLIFGTTGKLLYLLMYVSALVVCLLPTYSKHKNDTYYRSLGASGAVSAVVFANILVEPLQGIGLVFIPGIYIPGFLFGLIYLGITSYLDKRGGGNINHSAHMWGALYGIAFMIVASYVLSDYPILPEFIRKVESWWSTKFQ
jgi:membrane associated rhomboid family serine protease